MYEVTVEGKFSAAHRHPLPAGRGDAVHGHDFLVLVRIAGEHLEDDVLVDFHDVEVALEDHLGELHYRDLNEHPDFAGRAATPAALARWLHDRLSPHVARYDGLRLSSVEVRDTATTGARYEAGDRPPAVS